MIAAFILAFPIAAIVWAVANYYGYELPYVQALVYVLVAKVSAMYLKNDTNVSLTVVKDDKPFEIDRDHLAKIKRDLPRRDDE